MRHPHSGPPALQLKKKTPSSPNGDMPVLARIASGDERDEEAEYEQARHYGVLMEHSGEASMLPSYTASVLQSEIHTPAEGVGPQVLDADELARRMDALHMGLQAPQRPKVYRQKTPIGLRYAKDEQGNWKR